MMVDRSTLQVAWDVLREGKPTCAADIVAKGVSRSAVQNYLQAWERSRHIAFADKRGQTLFYRIAKDSVVAPPAARPNSAIPARGARSEHIWKAARQLREFTPRELASCSDVATEEDARVFCQMLLRGGYLKVLRKAVPGKRLAQYRLIRNSGPKAPVERRLRAVWDPNLGEYVHIPEVTS